MRHIFSTGDSHNSKTTQLPTRFNKIAFRGGAVAAVGVGIGAKYKNMNTVFDAQRNMCILNEGKCEL